MKNRDAKSISAEARKAPELNDLSASIEKSSEVKDSSASMQQNSLREANKKRVAKARITADFIRKLPEGI